MLTRRPGAEPRSFLPRSPGQGLPFPGGARLAFRDKSAAGDKRSKVGIHRVMDASRTALFTHISRVRFLNLVLIIAGWFCS